MLLTFLNEISIMFKMNLRKSTIEKFADVLIRFGEAAVIGSAATLFVERFPIRTSILGIFGGIVLLILGLYVNNISTIKGR